MTLGLEDNSKGYPFAKHIETLFFQLTYPLACRVRVDIADCSASVLCKVWQHLRPVDRLVNIGR